MLSHPSSVGSLLQANHQQLARYELLYTETKPETSIRQQCEKDFKMLEFLKITSQQIADKLQTLILKTELLYNKYTKVSELSSRPPATFMVGIFKISWLHYSLMHFDTCPFSKVKEKSCEKVRDGSIKIENTSTNQTITINRLQIHCIREHDFFSKEKTTWRLDPVAVCKLLELKPGVNYSKDLVITKFWSEYDFSSPCPPRHEATLKKNAIKTINLEQDRTIYVMKTKKVVQEEPAINFWGIGKANQLCEEDSKKEIEKEATLYLHLVSDSGEKFNIKGMEIEGAFLDLRDEVPMMGLSVFEQKNKIGVKLNGNEDQLLTIQERVPLV